MEEIPAFDTDKFTRIAQRYSRNGIVDFAFSMPAWVIFTAGLLCREAIAKALGVSDNVVMLAACTLIVVYLLYLCLSWRSRQADYQAFMESMFELEAHCRQIEATVKNGQDPANKS